MPNCAFCNEFASDNFAWKGRSFGSRLVRRGPLVIFPSVGDFEEGWQLVSPLEHYTSFASMPASLLLGTESVLQEARARLGTPLIVFEHGEGKDPKANSVNSVDHAHLHLVSTPDDVYDDLARHFVPRRIDSLADLSSCWEEKPYIFYEDANGKRTVFSVRGAIPSQFVRQLLWAKKTQSGWDWRQSPRVRSFGWTIRQFKQLFGEHILSPDRYLALEPRACPVCAGKDPSCPICSPAERDCPFCDPDEIAKRLIVESENFVVIPTIGQVTKHGGYCLFIPKEHQLCLGALTRSHMGELIALVEYVEPEMSNEWGLPIIFFEHGQSGQSVAHAHLHGVPSRADLFGRIKEDRHRENPIASLYELRGIYQKERAYLFYQNPGGQKYAFSLFRVPQYLRIVFAEAEGRPEQGNWRDVYKDPTLAELDQALAEETRARLFRRLHR